MAEENEVVVVVNNVYGDFCVRKARRKRQKLLIKELLFDYANNTTLHGLPYISKRGLTLVEKIFWLITFIVSITFCMFSISKVWYKWQTSPVIVTVSEELIPVNMVPFPSVTICPQIKCKATQYNYTAEKIKIDSFYKNEINITNMNATMKERIANFVDLSLICDDYFYYDLFDVYSGNYSDSSVFQHIYDVHPNYTDIFFWCDVRGSYQPCSDLFSETVTQEGICYTLNSLAADEIFRTKNIQPDYPYLNSSMPTIGWSMEHGYTGRKDSNTSLYPIPGAENGAFPDVEIILQDFLNDHDQLCNVINSGFKVYIQHPADLPQSSLYYYAVLNGQVSSMALSFSVLNTSENLRGYNPSVRQCYFSDERYLKYFKLYTANNCRIECLSNITYDICGCVEFYMPHDNSNTICTVKNSQCLMVAREKLLEQESERGSNKCHCLPSCSSVDYDAEILKTEYNLKQFLKVFSKLQGLSHSDLNGMKYSKLEIYFKRPRFIAMRRSELFGTTDFLANCGGLLGLFLGFSFLSLVEIFYFLTLRLCCTLKKDLEEEKAQAIAGKEVNLEKY